MEKFLTGGKGKGKVGRGEGRPASGDRSCRREGGGEKRRRETERQQRSRARKEEREVGKADLLKANVGTEHRRCL